ncbi:MAG: helix-turn-helix domain-containing protein [Roseburia sp.]|nr:helix-turn-helix domain-containing protein [Roseburia sp.]
MDVKMLEAKNHIDAFAGCLCRYVRSDTEYFRPHYHNYYELFLVMKGNVCHIINSKEQLLREGQLLFIRDFDVHDYIRGDDNYFEFINLAFSRETLESLFAFLGTGFPSEALLTAAYPPVVSLSEKDKEKLAYDFIELNVNSDGDYIRFKARSLLTYIFSNYFYNYVEEKTQIPAWLEITYEQMKRPENFTLGAAQMYQLSGKSREHLTRCMKRYYDTTPNAFVAELRLGHAANLLLISNLKVTDICYECGFENLSWFYKIFAGRYGMTPSEYRKQYKDNK